jgi:ABC-type amino acid transport system permease subunit
LFAAIAGIMILPAESKEISVEKDTFTNILWSARGLDVLVQIVLIFTGVLCMLGLLSEVRVPVKQRERVNVELLSPSTSNGHHHEPAEDEAPLEEIHA